MFHIADAAGRPLDRNGWPKALTPIEQIKDWRNLGHAAARALLKEGADIRFLSEARARLECDRHNPEVSDPLRLRPVLTSRPGAVLGSMTEAACLRADYCAGWLAQLDEARPMGVAAPGILALELPRDVEKLVVIGVALTDRAERAIWLHVLDEYQCAALWFWARKRADETDLAALLVAADRSGKPAAAIAFLRARARVKNASEAFHPSAPAKHWADTDRDDE